MRTVLRLVRIIRIGNGMLGIWFTKPFRFTRRTPRNSRMSDVCYVAAVRNSPGLKARTWPFQSPCTRCLKDAVRNLTQGRSLVLIPEERQLTTQQAGELLGVSRPFLIRLLDAGEMPFSLVGRHRRIKVSDVIGYSKRKSDRKSALDKMARDAHAAGLYDKSAGIPKGGRDE